MVSIRTTIVSIMIWSLVGLAPSSALPFSPTNYDIGSGGQAVIAGGVGASVTSSASTCTDLIVTVDFGELSPINQNGIVKVTVPVVIRSTPTYQVAVSVSGSVGADPNAVKLSDIGFGIRNLRPLPNANGCGGRIDPLFNNDPSTSVTVNGAGRATYPSSLSSIGASYVILGGPKLSKVSINPGIDCDNGWVFDAVLSVAPQYYVAGSFSLTLTFTISNGSNPAC
jgi:hypothetical protein